MAQVRNINKLDLADIIKRQGALAARGRGHKFSIGRHSGGGTVMPSPS